MARVLLVEDSPDDAEIVARALKKGALAFEMLRVDTLQDLETQLRSATWEILLLDFNLGSFTAFDVLELVSQLKAGIPCIVLSGSIGDEMAAKAMRAGARDFFRKDKLSRLPAAIERELLAAKDHRERQVAVQRVAERERQLSAIFSQSIIGVAQMTIAGDHLLVNDAYCRTLGQPREAVLQGRLHTYVSPEDLQEFEQGFEQAMAMRGSFVREFRRADNSDIWLNASISVVVDEQGQPACAVAMLEDITARRRADEELRAAVKVRDEFLSIASHELKTPITALELQIATSLRMFSQSKAEGNPDKLQKKLRIAAKQVSRMNALINNLLDVARLTSGRVFISREEIDLRDVVLSAVTQLQDTARNAGSGMTIRMDHPCVGYWDPGALESVLCNLITNAVKYGRGKPIEISLGAHDDQAELRVVDHGLGIDADDQRRIFERFERAVPARHYGGFGLGLWIVRNIVQAHGGSINVTSKKGCGSAFVVQLPLQAHM